MIKLALQHWVFEKCIDLVFNSIAMNFTKAGQGRLETGKTYALLHFKVEVPADGQYIEFSIYEGVVTAYYPDVDSYEIRFQSMITRTNIDHYASASAFVKHPDGYYVQAWNGGTSIFVATGLKYYRLTDD